TYLRKEGSTNVTVTRHEGSCPALSDNEGCTATGEEVCTEGPETRMIEGVAVTQACWAWSRTFSCRRITQGNDCTDLDANRQCRFLRDECLDDPQSGA
ncbi:conjugal transfer protein TraN, partial [Enterobacter hormaechei]|nr:conjugal transfer protein TraN [Enterobacter hormaechei]